MKRILIVRPDGIGDFIIFSAVLEQYAQLFPGYRIDLLCHHKVRDVAATVPYFTHIYGIDQFQMRRPGYWIRLLKNIAVLSLNNYDQVICPVYSRNREIDLMVRLIQCREKIGFDGNISNDPDGKRLARNRWYTRIIESDPAPKKEIERNAEFIRKLGAKVDDSRLEPKIWFRPEDDSTTRAILADYDLKPGEYICVFPGAGFPIRYWNDASWSTLIDALLVRYPQLKIAMLGFGRDIEPIRGIEAGVNIIHRGRLINLYQKTTLRQMAKTISLSRMCITMETGAVHMAAAVGAPSVCIIGGGHFGRFYPYGDPERNRIVFHKMDCYGCDWRCIYETSRCIKNIAVEDVLKEVEIILKARLQERVAS